MYTSTRDKQRRMKSCQAALQAAGIGSCRGILASGRNSGRIYFREIRTGAGWLFTAGCLQPARMYYNQDRKFRGSIYFPHVKTRQKINTDSHPLSITNTITPRLHAFRVTRSRVVPRQNPARTSFASARSFATLLFNRGRDSNFSIVHSRSLFASSLSEIGSSSTSPS